MSRPMIESIELAQTLAGLGVEKGTRVGMLSVNCPPIYRNLFCRGQNRGHLRSLEFQGQGR